MMMDGAWSGRADRLLEEVHIEHPPASLVPGRHTVCSDTWLAVYGRERFAVLRVPLVDQRHGRRPRGQSALGCIPRAGLQREPSQCSAKSQHGCRADGLESESLKGFRLRSCRGLWMRSSRHPRLNWWRLHLALARPDAERQPASGPARPGNFRPEPACCRCTFGWLLATPSIHPITRDIECCWLSRSSKPRR